VRPPRVAECPVQLESRIAKVHPFEDEDDYLTAIEVRIVRVHVEENILAPGEKNYIDPEKWNPLIMNFAEFFGLSGKIHPSKLAQVYGPRRNNETKETNLRFLHTSGDDVKCDRISIYLLFTFFSSSGPPSAV